MMGKYFNIGGPCCAADHYMLAATERLPEVTSLVDKKQYFVIHAPRQCGKMTMFLGWEDDPSRLLLKRMIFPRRMAECERRGKELLFWAS